ncbi:hypothetical protein NE865_10065 [Phthorimaea operculella]|nr:hypothetical protein NE865_10065 [Phthorimaea operculella]
MLYDEIDCKMKEININIEGYNVNGICVGCLNYNRKMYYHKDIHECFKNLADIDVPDGLSIQVCCECLAAVRNANRFREQILRAFDILMDYSAKNTFLNSPSDLSQYSVQRLSMTTPNVTTVGDLAVEPIVSDEKVDIEIDVKSEVDIENDMDFDLDQPLDSLDPKLEADYSQDAISDYPDVPDVDLEPQYSSDEDIQLSKLKKKKDKVKKGRKSKKEKKCRKDVDESKPEKVEIKEENPKVTRKLKNLPENMVSLYTMTEEEMWQPTKEIVKPKQSREERLEKKRLAERLRSERIKNNPVLYEQRKARHLERYYKKKREGTIVHVEKMSAQQQKIMKKRSRILPKQSREETLEKKRLAERLRSERIKNDPVLYEQRKARHLERYYKKKREGAIVRKIMRERSRISSNKYNAKKRILKEVEKQIRSEDLASKEFESLKYKCSDCIIGFNTEKLMIDHMSGKHQPKSADCRQCDVCKAYFLTKDNLATHRALHLTAYHCLT